MSMHPSKLPIYQPRVMISSGTQGRDKSEKQRKQDSSGSNRYDFLMPLPQAQGKKTGCNQRDAFQYHFFFKCMPQGQEGVVTGEMEL